MQRGFANVQPERVLDNQRRWKQLQREREHHLDHPVRRGGKIKGGMDGCGLGV